ncbi:MAG: hypothetical protein IIZ53_02160 [Ruminococcus sp.]|nr:hypothetical protein [Ruminococcus sp.]
MNTDQLLDAIGDISDKYINEAHQTRIIKKHRFKPFAIAAAAVLCIAAPLPLGVAAGSENAYNTLYMFAPSVAQTFKPVEESCVDQGIRMEVISAEINGSEASIFLSMQDLEEDRLDETVDLYDSYDIHLPYDQYGHCSFNKYDPETKTAYFVVHIARMDGKDIRSGKMTFSVGCFLSHKKKTERFLDEIDLSNIPEATDTFFPENTNVWAEMDGEEAKNTKCIKPSDTPIFYAADGAAVTGYGLVDGKLHIQMNYENRHETDNHGFISLIGGSGQTDHGEVVFFGNYDYNEYIFDVSPDDLADSRLYGEFVSSPPYMKGNWEVTFRLDK